VKSYLLRRAFLILPILWGVLTLVFSLIHLIPGDPAQTMLGEGASPADVAALRQRLGLERPLTEQYARFLSGALRADLGESFRYEEPVAALIAERLPATFALAVAAMALALALALPAGLVAAADRGGPFDLGARLAALAGVSIPSIWLGPMLILLLAIRRDWFPVSGWESPGALVLPALTLGLGLSGLTARMARGGLLEEIGRGYVLAARARGAAPARIWVGHALRNALIPVVTVVGLQFGSLLTGAVITETIFSWPGLGRLLVQAIQYRDYPLVQGCVLTIAAVYVTVNLLTDLAYGWADPRIRFS
jgi:ABC-type dipeptide/oligopeptide/nickel transport system permease component